MGSYDSGNRGNEYESQRSAHDDGDNQDDEGGNLRGNGDNSQPEDGSGSGSDVVEPNDEDIGAQFGVGEDVDAGDQEDGGRITASKESGQVSLTIPTWLRAPEPVFVVAPTTWHQDWNAWDKYFAEYKVQTHQVLPRFDVMSRSERKKRLQKTKKCREGGIELMPEGLDPYQRTYICTHGWPPRKNKTCVLMKRPRQHIRYTECPFRIFVQWREKEGRWQLQVRGGQFVDNHSVSVDTYSTFPCARGITDSRVEARVEGKLEAGAKRSKIYDYLLEHNQNVIQSDVDNLVRNHSSAVSSVNDDDVMAAEIANFMAEDQQNVATVAATVKGEAGVISLASAHMRNV